MEENIQNQPEDISNDIPTTDDISINLDEDYVMDWDSSNTEDNAIQERETEAVSLGERAEDSEEVDGSLRVESDQEEHADEGQSEEEGDVEDHSIELGQVQQYEDEEEDPRYESEEDDYEDEYEDDEYEDEADDFEFGEEWDKLFEFMEEFPGATPEDYVKTARGADGLEDKDVLMLHLAQENGLDAIEDKEELEFLYDDKFGYDEELDSDRDIKLKKIEAKKTLREAKEHLSDLQLKYGADLKFGSDDPEIKEAFKFKEEQLELQQQQQELADDFQSRTHDFFNDGFKGFEFEYGDGQVQTIKAGKDAAEFQSDITNFISQYVGEDGAIDDMQGYHKALWAAQNADALFSHAYEQGRADAVRSSAKNAKNIDMDPRKDRSAESVTKQGKFTLLDEGDHTEDFKFNI